MLQIRTNCIFVLYLGEVTHNVTAFAPASEGGSLIIIVVTSRDIIENVQGIYIDETDAIKIDMERIITVAIRVAYKILVCMMVMIIGSIGIKAVTSLRNSHADQILPQSFHETYLILPISQVMSPR